MTQPSTVCRKTDADASIALLNPDIFALVAGFIDSTPLAHWRFRNVCKAWHSADVQQWSAELRDIDSVMEGRTRGMSFESSYRRVYQHFAGPAATPCSKSIFHATTCDRIRDKTIAIVNDHVAKYGGRRPNFDRLCARLCYIACMLDDVHLYMCNVYCTTNRRMTPSRVCMQTFMTACKRHKLGRLHYRRRSWLSEPKRVALHRR